MPAAEERFDPKPALAALDEAGVDFVVIGGLAGGVHGSAYPTYDVDVAYSRDRENLERLASILRELGATLRGAPKDLPFQLDAETLEKGGNFTFDTSLGKLDILAYPAGSPPYESLRAKALPVEIDGRTIRFASLDHLIAMKEAAGRPHDVVTAQELRLIADRLRAPP